MNYTPVAAFNCKSAPTTPLELREVFLEMFILHIFIYCVCALESTINNVFMWKAEGSLLVSDLSFHCAGKDQTHFLKQGSHPLYHTS